MYMYTDFMLHTLDHKVLNNSMKRGSLVSLRNAIFSVFPGAQLTEILRCLGDHVCKQLHLHAPHVLAADGYVEEYDWILLFQVGLGHCAGQGNVHS